jgi:hypothetical protein
MKIWDQKHKNPNLKTKRNEDKYVLSIEEKKEEEEEEEERNDHFWQTMPIQLWNIL